MGRDLGVIAPDLVEKGIAPDDLVLGAIEIFEDRGFLLDEVWGYPARS